jgi:hypothetical protein
VTTPPPPPPPDHILLDRAPNLGPLISRLELDKFKNFWNKSFRIYKILTLLYKQFSNLFISQWDMSGARLGALSNNRWSGDVIRIKKLSHFLYLPREYQNASLHFGRSFTLVNALASNGQRTASREIEKKRSDYLSVSAIYLVYSLPISCCFGSANAGPLSCFCARLILSSFFFNYSPWQTASHRGHEGFFQEWKWRMIP